ncbi:alpha/beta fold hydrolase [Microbacterium sp. SORGH_AS_0888]|uniref:alpha/beta fold hydrolase n=1 Tax=Microbacterium sp. SORGH_AS_0888 TaxID=3041791 RepID=UPI00278232FE|nr:alpha/beta fold hydrolase [Microbacterium sp. SORGH_AS_0888]MDQ1129683.1 pimeloyl-ACP methyl ester carboxylesterase [Microbacterium sp. SORGH_AS_0888]
MQERDLDLPIALSMLGSAPGEPAIVLPGGPCRGPAYLGDLAGVGEERALVVAHPRGTPRSGGLSRGWWTDADDVVALIDALGLDAADIVAHSAGTRLALATAARFPSRVRSLALITPPASWLTETPSDAEEIVASLAGPEAREAFAALADDDGTEAGFQAALRRQAPVGYARWGDPRCGARAARRLRPLPVGRAAGGVPARAGRVAASAAVRRVATAVQKGNSSGGSASCGFSGELSGVKAGMWRSGWTV